METFQQILAGEQRSLFLVLALSFMLLEYITARALGKHTHNAKESAASFGVALGNIAIRAALAGLVAAPFMLVYEQRIFTLPHDTLWGLVLLFFGVEFCYYWQHRAAHQIRWFWASHNVHHSPSKINLTAAIRLGWTGLLSGNFLFYLPLIWLGFHPIAVVALLAFNLNYQLFLHTELVRSLGPLEWVFNTPAHHRVHHASNTECLDKNFGGILIIYDRIFGTFAKQPASEALRYGLTKPLLSHNPVRIAFYEWGRMWQDMKQAWKPGRKTLRRTELRQMGRILFGPPS